MSKQKITYPDYGSRSMRVLEALTPLTGAAAPVEHADFIGQIYVETTTPALYVATATDSDEAANDWALSTIAALPAAVSAAILEADIPAAVAAAILEADIPAAVAAAILEADIPAAVAAAILEADIPGQIELKAAEFEPLTGLVSPSTHADFIGQIYVDTALGKGYMAIATDSADAADDWKEITLS